jgi:hypothetical protein
MVRCWQANTAAPVSLIPLGSQRIWAHAETNRRAMDPSTPSIEDVGIYHCGANIPVPKQLLHCPDIVAGFQFMRCEGMARLLEVEAGGAGGVAPGARGSWCHGKARPCAVRC